MVASPSVPALPADPRTPLHRRIERALRAAVAEGRYRPGDRLPSVATLAAAWHVGRLTVLKAFRRLDADGLLTSHVGRGTFVAGGATAPRTDAASATPPTDRSASGGALRRLRRGYAGQLAAVLSVERAPGTIDLAGGVPSPDAVGRDALRDLAVRAASGDARRLHGYAGSAGLVELREEIARRLAKDGVDVSADQVVVTNGSQQGSALVAAWARETGRAVLCETPTFQGTPAAFALFGHAVRSVPRTDAGCDPATVAAAAGGEPSLLYLCADFHNPTGLTISTADRRALARLAAASDVAVIDDRIFRDLRFEGEAQESLYPMLPTARRFLVGSISKTFTTGLRIGYLVADPEVVETLLDARRAMDLGGPPLLQAMAAEMLRDDYDAHVARMRERNRAGRDVALEALERVMPAGTRWTRPEGGFQAWVTLPDGLSSVALFLEGVERGVAIVPGPAHDADGRYADSFRLGYGHGTLDELREGVRRLGEAANALVRRGPRASRGLGQPV